MSIEVSFVIPTYHRLKYLEKAIESILLQSFSNVEVIIVDDEPSSKIELKLVEKYGDKIRYYKNKENLGPGFCRRFGLSVSRGSFIVFMDDDDYYIRDDFLKKAVRRLKVNQTLAFISFSVNDFFEKEQKILKPKRLEYDGNISRKKFIKSFGFKYNKPTSTFTTVFRRSSLIKSGILDVYMLNDTVIYLRSLLEGDAFIDQTIMGNYRHHDNNITKTISIEFIIENIKEKKYISDLLPYNYMYRNYWLYRQSWYSIAYYICNHKKNMDIYVLKSWIREQQTICRFLISSRLYFELFKLYLKG
ncbi:glycosyltransferase family 2 protein [Liquorilactobacillus capillatus]|uniref:Epsk n=1 Tax=Liquorilactobacillus capillatus DSM 19910 TaxID=1423731 RepID=A0A0R1M3J6_9LACO|nr:glycosyltransferase family 2 protein [Liquorilactobacillus capillatus]KRL02598.1 epsk [Liquorilactobacillus capillatus DSM 19910]